MLQSVAFPLYSLGNEIACACGRLLRVWGKYIVAGGVTLKRVMLVICIGMIAAIGILGAFYPKSDAISFDSAIFSERMEWFSSEEGDYTAADVFGGAERVLGYIGNAKEAAKKAEDLWAELYGEVERERKPYTVSHDKENGVWMVQGGFHGLLGGRPFVLLRESDGKVLAVWHTV